MINISSLRDRIKSLLMRNHSKTQEPAQASSSQSYYPPSQARTLLNTLIPEEEFEVQRALGSLKWFQFYDEVQVDDSGMGDGPFIVWSTDYEQAKQVYMEKHGNTHGFSGARDANAWLV